MESYLALLSQEQTLLQWPAQLGMARHGCDVSCFTDAGDVARGGAGYAPA
ncbi:predicted protein [Streptomyces iranensis]|uniref:Uncharacterized protein n=1 Tax=Streptomyces iranensis TaxID=576784 RepID=A0A060ZLS2_9ACTN|nr:predicted protein [Streptomyces iranensis]